MSLELAITAAKANPIRKLPKMAAVICDRRHVVSIGLNSYRTHPLQAKFAKNKEAICLHAEIAAIVNSRTVLKGMSMFIARVNSKGEPVLAKPCSGCQRALIQHGFKDVTWTQ